MKKPSNPKERNLIKGALRRVFSRSELRRQALALSIVEHSDPARPRVTKWSKCPSCTLFHPTYLMQVDHIEPIVPTTGKLESMTWDEVVDRMWCDVKNLKAICKPCHKVKTSLEAKQRRLNKVKAA